MKALVAAIIVLLVGVIGASAYLMLSQTALPSWSQQEEARVAEEDEGPPEKAQADITPRKPLETPADVREQIVKVRKINPDVIGWIRIPGTDISNPVLQSHDNVYYLRKNEYKEEDVYGCYFADYECSFGTREEMSVNTIVYGHSDLKDNPDGPRFSQLLRFTQQDFARTHPYIYFDTEGVPMIWQVFAAFYTDTNMNYIDPNLTPQALDALTQEAKKKSLYVYDVPIAPEDKILTLSTCTVLYGNRDDQRFVVMAKLLPQDSQLERTAQIHVNDLRMEPNFS